MPTLTRKLDFGKLSLTILMLLFSSTMVLPLIWMISTSFKIEAEVFEFPLRLIPRQLNVIQNYAEVWGEKARFGMYYLNSIKVTVLTTFFQVFLSALGAYGFSKVHFSRWRSCACCCIAIACSRCCICCFRSMTERVASAACR